MRIKKFWLLAVSAILVVSLFAFAACGGNDDPDATPAPGTPAPATPAPATPAPATPAPTPEPTPEPEPEWQGFADNFVYSLRNDPYIQALTIPTMGADNIFLSEWLTNAGGPSFAIVEASEYNYGWSPTGTKGIRVTNREANWNGVDIRTDELGWDIANHHYAITVRGRAVFQDGAEGDTVNVGINKADAPWGPAFATATVTLNADLEGPFNMTAIFTSATHISDAERNYVRISGQEEVDIFIYDIEVHRVTESPAANVLWSLDSDPLFQALPVNTMGAGNVFVTPLLQSVGPPSYRVVAGPYGNAIFVGNRDAEWQSVDFRTQTLGMRFANNTYTLVVSGRTNEGETARIGAGDPPWTGFLTTEVNDDGTFTHEIEITPEAIEGTGVRGHFRLTTGGTEEFIIYNITVYRIPN